MPRVGHRTVRPRKRVVVWFANGTTTRDRYLGGTDRYAFFERMGKVDRGTIKAMSIDKNKEDP